MAPIFSGTLPPKKKYELQEIAAALRLSDQGTKDEIHTRIKKHLDKNQATLEDDPTFAGLFGRRRRSVQPPSVPPRFASFTAQTILLALFFSPVRALHLPMQHQLNLALPWAVALQH